MIMITQTFILGVEYDVTFTRMLGYSGFQVVADYLQRSSFKEVQHIDVTFKPRVHFHVQTRLDIGIAAVR